MSKVPISSLPLATSVDGEEVLSGVQAGTTKGIPLSLIWTLVGGGEPAGIGTSAQTTVWLQIAAGTTARAQINLPVSAAPTAPVDGDIWREDNTNTGLKIRINGVTKTVTVS